MDETPPKEAPKEAPKDPAKEASARAFFEGLFDAVLDEIERNPDFAERLAQRLSRGLDRDVQLVVKNRKRRLDAPPPELEALDIVAILESEGQFALRERLGAFTNAELAALIKARSLSSEPVSKLNKSQLANILVRAAKAGE